MTKKLSPKAKKIINIVVDVIVAAILVIVLILAISVISSRAKGYHGYTEIFGKAYLAVESDSMEGSQSDSFNKGDMIVVKTISKSEMANLKVGQIITFTTTEIVEGERVLNSHRIISKQALGDGSTGEYIFVTQGDKNAEAGGTTTETVMMSQIVGVYESKIENLGNFALFMKSTPGFIVFVLVPCLIIVAYFTVNLILVVKKEKKVQKAAAAEEHEKQLADEKERMRAEIMAELAAKESAENVDENKPDKNISEGGEPESDKE